MKLTINFKSVLLLIALTSLIFSVAINCVSEKANELKSLNRFREDEKKDDKAKKEAAADKKTEAKKETKKAEAVKKPAKAQKKAVKQTKESAKQLAKSYIHFAKQPYCEEQKTCAACKEIQGKGFTLVASEKAKSGAATISMVINRNAQKKETVISFAGPKSKDLNFIQSIYINGFSADAEKALNAPIEKVFWDAYTAIKPKLVKQITEILLSSEEESVLFIGHSFGGSLAILASYDLKKNNIINKSHKPKVITFAALKIGNIGFIKSLHAIIPVGVIRLRSIFDLYTFIPRCVFIPSLNVFHCYTSYVTLVRVWPIFARYVYTYYPIIRSKIAWAAPGVVKSLGFNSPALQKPSKALPGKSSLKKPVAHHTSSSSFNKKTQKQKTHKSRSLINKVGTKNAKHLSHLKKLLQHGKINRSRTSSRSAIKRSTSLSSLLSKVNTSSGLYKKLMHKSLGKSKAVKRRNSFKRRNRSFKKVIFY